MSLFTYQAVDARGMSRSGEIESGSRAAALDALHRRGLVPIAVNEGAIADSKVSLSERLRTFSFLPANRVDIKDLLGLTQSLSALLKAGLTIDRALAITTNLCRQEQTKLLLESVGKAVRSGKSFADALTETHAVLPPYYIGMVQAGEAGGQLAQTLSRLSELLQKQHEIRERIRSALVYPAILGGVVLLTVVLLLAFVLPRFEALFAESDAPLPWSTRSVLAVGHFVTGYWWLLLIVGIAASVAVTWLVRSKEGRERIDAWLLNSRWTLGIPVAIDSARLLRTLSTLLTNGVPLASAMRIARATLSNSRLRKGLDEAAKRIKAGESTSVALAAAEVFPAHAVQLARVGEETGRLEELLLEAATILENESHTSLQRLLTLLVPALTIVMGLLVAGLIGSVLIGLLSINDLAF
jgi:general secretion pathway protein F